MQKATSDIQVSVTGYGGDWRVVLAAPVEPQVQILLAVSGPLTTAGVDRLCEHLAILRQCVSAPPDALPNDPNP